MVCEHHLASLVVLTDPLQAETNVPRPDTKHAPDITGLTTLIDPHAYNDYEKFTFSHAHKPYLEFPIEQNGKVYDGESPGADRIVIGSISEDYQSAVFCAVITHDGQKKNGFAECADDTMNVNGKGEYQGHGDDEESHGHHHKRHHHNRKLLDRIDMPN